MPHATHPPELAPSDFALLPKLKKSIAEQKFFSNKEVIALTEAYLAVHELNEIFDKIKKMKDCWVKYLVLRGNYVDRHNCKFSVFLLKAK